MIKIEKLKFGYSKDRLLFDNLDLSLSGGCIYGLLGRNGTGKTSLLKVIMGMCFPKSGVCKVFGLPSEKRLPSMLCEMMFVPEEIFTPSLRIAEYESSYAGFYPRFDHKLFKTLLKEFELNEADKLKSLSLGERKKALLAFAMAANTKILIMDEPTNGLDIPSKSQFRQMIASLAMENRCIIVSTHQAQDIEKLIDSVIILDNGDILIQSDMEQIVRKLAFQISPEKPSGALYSEEKMGGVYSVSKNDDEGACGEFHLDLLFNATMANKTAMKELFNHKKS
ncbi:MAG: ABC transporter ATP-binding protein [Bacteroidales bacterium]|jgi:ABC-2 type transport system ATP-binding protein|nr:ABC transporter ATP-binding protein [Bacteroidales bacterium]